MVLHGCRIRISRGVLLLDALSRGLELLGLLVAFFDLLIVLEVVEELGPSDELLVIDGIFLLGQLHHLVHFVSLDLVEDLVEGQNLVLRAGDAHSFSINEVNYFHVHA